MESTPRLLDIQKLVRRVKIVNRKIVQDEHLAFDTDGSVTREYLRRMTGDDLLARFGRRTEHYVQTAPVYTPTEHGCCLLATHTGDMRYLLDCPPKFSAQDVPHHLGVSRLIIDFDKAVARQNSPYVRAPQLFTEHDYVNPNEPDPKKKIKLLTVVGHGAKGGNMVCVPDFAALVCVGRFSRAYAFEFETGSDGSPARVAARKSPGYYGLVKSEKFKLHFPAAQDMKVIAVCPNVGWREGLRKAMQDKKGAEWWLFVDRNDLKPETFLHAPVFYMCGEEGPKPLVKLPGG